MSTIFFQRFVESEKKLLNAQSIYFLNSFSVFYFVLSNFVDSISRTECLIKKTFFKQGEMKLIGF